MRGDLRRGLFVGVRGAGAEPIPVRVPDADHLRHNLPQELLAAIHGIWQATASRVLAAYTPLVAQALESSVPTVEDLNPTVQLIVDRTQGAKSVGGWSLVPVVWVRWFRSSGLGTVMIWVRLGRAVPRSLQHQAVALYETTPGAGVSGIARDPGIERGALCRWPVR